MFVCLFVFSIDPKNINLVEDVEILILVKSPLIPFGGLRGEVENVSANQRPGRLSCFPIGPKITNFVEDMEVLLQIYSPFSSYDIRDSAFDDNERINSFD